MKKKIDIQSDYNKKLDLLKKYDHNYFNLDSLWYQTLNMINLKGHF